MIRHVLRSWASLRWPEALVFATGALLFGAIDLTSLLELNPGDQLPQLLARHLGVPLIGCVVLMLCWLPASRSSLRDGTAAYSDGADVLWQGGRLSDRSEVFRLLRVPPTTPR